MSLVTPGGTKDGSPWSPQEGRASAFLLRVDRRYYLLVLLRSRAGAQPFTIYSRVDARPIWTELTHTLTELSDSDGP
jgi:hypothetical protein